MQDVYIYINIIDVQSIDHTLIVWNCLTAHGFQFLLWELQPPSHQFHICRWHPGRRCRAQWDLLSPGFGSMVSGKPWNLQDSNDVTCSRVGGRFWILEISCEPWLPRKHTLEADSNYEFGRWSLWFFTWHVSTKVWFVHMHPCMKVKTSWKTQGLPVETMTMERNMTWPWPCLKTRMWKGPQHWLHFVLVPPF